MHKRHYEKFADGSVKDIEDEIPFDVPDGWSWCRLKEISLDMADGPFGSNLKTEHYTTRKEARLIQLSNIGEEGWREENTKYTTFEHAKKNISRSIVESGNIVIAKMMPAGRAIICPNNEKMYVLSSDAVKLIPSILIYSKYLLNTINSPSFRNSVTDNVQGSTRLRTSISKLKECFIPLPPLSEQQLIVAEIEKIFAQIDLLEQNKTDLQTAIKQAKSKILDLAIHGKLVSQDPNDEPASALLEKIRAEKEAKIAKGELKRDKNDSYIYKGSDNCHYEKLNDKDVCIEDDLPFAIPDNWQWCRLKNIGYSISSKPYQILEKQIKNKGKLPVISQSGSFIEGYTDEIQFIFEDYPVIIFGDHTKNVKYIDFCFIVGADGVKIIKPNKYINSKFFYYLILDASTKIEDRGYGRHFQFIDKYFYALPPLTEQQRIVSKIEELFSLLDQIQTNLI